MSAANFGRWQRRNTCDTVIRSVTLQTETLPTSRRSTISPDGRRDEDAAILPEAVDAALDPKGQKVALEGFGVIADLPDDVECPSVVEPEHLAEIPAAADKALDRGIGLVRSLGDIPRGQAKLFGLDHREHAPADDIGPAGLAAAYGDAERLLGDDIRQNNVRRFIRRGRS